MTVDAPDVHAGPAAHAVPVRGAVRRAAGVPLRATADVATSSRAGSTAGRRRDLLLRAARRRAGDVAQGRRRRGRGQPDVVPRLVRRRLERLPRRPGAAGLRPVGAGHRDVPDSSSWTRPCCATIMREWFPMAQHLLAGCSRAHHPAAHHRPARAAAGARVAVGRADPRAEQPGRRRGAGDLGPAAAGVEDARRSWRRWPPGTSTRRRCRR